MLISIGTVCLVSALETQFFVDNTTPLIGPIWLYFVCCLFAYLAVLTEAAVPALIGVCTVGFSAVAGALLHVRWNCFVFFPTTSTHCVYCRFSLDSRRLRRLLFYGVVRFIPNGCGLSLA